MLEISDCLQLNDCPHDYDWYACMNEYGIVECTTHNAPQRNYVLTVYPHQLDKQKAQEILDANLGKGNYDAETERVTIRDIFMHGEFVKFLSEGAA